MQRTHFTLVQGTARWMSDDQHDYVHLLDTVLPEGTCDETTLAKTLVEFRPEKERLRLPLRLASWMQSMSTVRTWT